MNQDRKPAKQNIKSGKSTIDKSRRQLTKLGAAAPVIATIAGRPAWGAQCSPSAVLSHTNASHNPDSATNCSLGCSPGYWKNCKSDWTKMTAYSRNMLFCDVFFAGDADKCPFDDKTLGQVINGETDSCKNKLSSKHQGHNFENAWSKIRIAGIHAIAAMLNASAHEFDAIGGNLGYLSQMPNEIIAAFHIAYDQYHTHQNTATLVEFKNIFDQYGDGSALEVICVFNAHGDVSANNYWINQSMSFKEDY